MLTNGLLGRALGTADDKVCERGSLKSRGPLEQFLLLRCDTRLNAFLLWWRSYYHGSLLRLCCATRALDCATLEPTVRHIAVRVKTRIGTGCARQLLQPQRRAHHLISRPRGSQKAKNSTSAVAPI